MVVPGTRGGLRAGVGLAGGWVVIDWLSPAGCPARPVLRRKGPHGPRDRGGWSPWEVRCGFRGRGAAQVRPTGLLAGARRGGVGADPVLAVAEGRDGAGSGAPGAARQLFPARSRAGERSPRDGLGTVSGCLGASAHLEELRPRDRLKMRPGRTGGAPLRLVLVLSQGERGVCCAWAAGPGAGAGS